jgi:glycerol-3-phosphate dehydrogenase
MAEEAVDCAVEVGGLEAQPCVTHNLTLLGAEEKTDHAEPEKLLDPALPYTLTDVERAVTEEMAVTLADVLCRRTRSLFLDVEAAKRIAPQVAETMGDSLGKSRDWAASQIDALENLLPSYSPAVSQSPSVDDPEGS